MPSEKRRRAGGTLDCSMIRVFTPKKCARHYPERTSRVQSLRPSVFPCIYAPRSVRLGSLRLRLAHYRTARNLRTTAGESNAKHKLNTAAIFYTRTSGAVSFGDRVNQFNSPLVGVDLSLLADEVGETAPHSPDGGQRVLHL